MKSLIESLARILYTSRPWHRREQQKYPLHPSVQRALSEEDPRSWHEVVLQWPHVAEDPTRLAYTQSEAKGMIDRQTVTSVGKYLKSMWPDTPDHVIRDWVAVHSVDQFELRKTKREIIQAAEMGPRSCMQSASTYCHHPFAGKNLHKQNFADLDDDQLDLHPYAAYDPKYGWAVAVRLSSGRIMGRALVNTESETYVRSYARGETDESSSNTDYALDAWMEQQGFTDASGWEDGLKLARIEHPTERGPLVPYLDGSNDKVSDCGTYLVIDDDGEYQCDNTDGSATEIGSSRIGDCTACGDSICEDDSYTYAGRHEEDLVCDHCAEYCFTMVRGHSNYRAGYREYLVHNDNAASVVDRDYYVDSDDVPNFIVQLENGDYAHVEDAVEIEGEFYLVNDNDVVWLDNGDYALIDDTWEDGNRARHHDNTEYWTDHNGDKWTMDEESEEVDGELWRVCDIEQVRAAAQVAPLFSEV